MAFDIIKVIVSVLEIPLWLIGMFRDKFLVPGVEGEVEEKILQMNLIEKLDKTGLSVITIIMIVITVASIVLGVCALITKKETVSRISTVLFFVSLALFATSMILGFVTHLHY